MAQEAFDLAEQFQTPVFVMTDLDLGMNNWMSDGFKYPDKPINRGKRLTPEILKKLGEWGRYKDVDGDGIPYRTVPGDGMPAEDCASARECALALRDHVGVVVGDPDPFPRDLEYVRGDLG